MMRNTKQTLRDKRDAVKQLLISTTFRASLLLIAVVLLVLDVMQVSAVSTKGYDISEYEHQIEVLQQENERLEFQIATSRSMQSIESRMAALQLVDAEYPQFTRIMETAVARR